MARQWNLGEAWKMRKAGTSWDRIARHYGLNRSTVRFRLDPEYAEARREELRSVGDRQLGQRITGLVKRADADWRHLRELIPDDTRDLTGRLMGDPIPNDPRRQWAAR